MPSRVNRKSIPWGVTTELPTEIKLLSFGENKFWDALGNTEIDILDKVDAIRIVSDSKRRDVDLWVDYEHDKKEAAGWFEVGLKEDGLWALNISWTDRAKELIAKKEYRFTSPSYFVEEKEDGTRFIVGFENFAITNNPATDKCRPLVERSVNNTRLVAKATNRGESMTLSEIFEAYCQDISALLSSWDIELSESRQEDLKALCSRWEGMFADALPELVGDADEESAAMGEDDEDRSVDANEAVDEESVEIASVAKEVTGLDDGDEVIGALRAFAEMPSELKSERSAKETLEQRVSDLESEIQSQKVESLVEDAITKGRITPAQRSLAVQMGKDNIKTLRSFIKTQVPKGPGIKADKAPSAVADVPEEDKPKMVSITKTERDLMNKFGLDKEEDLEAFKRVKAKDLGKRIVR